MKKITIETERLILRNLELSDAETIFDYAKSPNVGPHAGWEPHKNIDETREWIKSHLDKTLLFGIVWKQSGKVIGQIELKPPKFKRFAGAKISENSMELGFVLSEKFWGKGIMPEAAKAVIDYAFITLKLDEVLCGHAEANLQSGRVQEKLGFKIICRQKDYITWVDGNKTDHIGRKLTKKDWLKTYKKLS